MLFPLGTVAYLNKIKCRFKVTQTKVVRFIHGYLARTPLKISVFRHISWLTLNIDNRVTLVGLTLIIESH